MVSGDSAAQESRADAAGVCPSRQFPQPTLRVAVRPRLKSKLCPFPGFDIACKTP